MIAAEVNTKALPTYMGHSSITVTLNRYDHLMPGSEAEAPHARGLPRAGGGLTLRKRRAATAPES